MPSLLSPSAVPCGPTIWLNRSAPAWSAWGPGRAMNGRIPELAICEVADPHSERRLDPMRIIYGSITVGDFS